METIICRRDADGRSRIRPPPGLLGLVERLEQQAEAGAVHEGDFRRVEPDEFLTLLSGRARLTSPAAMPAASIRPAQVWITVPGGRETISGVSLAGRRENLHRFFLAVQGQEEKEEILAVPAEQAARLLGQAVHPFQARALHPDRGAGEFPGHEIEARADADGTRHAEFAVVHVNPFFLLGRAQRDEQDVRLRGMYQGGDFLVVEVVQPRKGWGVGAADLQARDGVLPTAFSPCRAPPRRCRGRTGGSRVARRARRGGA